MTTFLRKMGAPVVLVCLMLVAASCSKDNETVPSQDQTATTELDLKQPAPGTYKITKFIDTGDDETSQFNGYTFQFQADGDLIATTASGQVFNGSWDLNNAETVMTIVISGNAALDDLDDDHWNVAKITDQKIKIRKNGPDIVTFNKI